MTTPRRIWAVLGFLLLTACLPQPKAQTDPDPPADPPEVHRYWLPPGLDHQSELICDGPGMNEPPDRPACRTVAEVRLYLRSARAEQGADSLLRKPAAGDVLALHRGPRAEDMDSPLRGFSSLQTQPTGR